MITTYILLQAGTNSSWDLLMGILISLVPFILGWLAAMAYYKVSEKDGEIKRIKSLNAELDEKANTQERNLTEVRMALSKAEAELQDRNQRITHMRNELIVAESERNLLREKIGPAEADAYLKANLAQPVEFEGIYYAPNDFRLFKGVDGDLANKLNGAGLKTWAGLASADRNKLDGVLLGSGLTAADLSKQAKFAVDADWDGLKKFQAGLSLAAASKNAGAPRDGSVEFDGKKWKVDNLQIVEGIGPKIAELLTNAGIRTWDELCKASPDRIREILDAAGSQFNMHDPSTWPEQACLANAGNWTALKEIQDRLIGGRGNTGSRAPKAVDFNGKTYIWDDLKIVEGIGPKIEDLLHAAGIKTWKQLSQTDVTKLKEILNGGGSSFTMHDPGSWPQQAGLAQNEQWDDLKRLQDELQGGR